MPPSITSLCVCLIVLVATFAPYVALQRKHEEQLGTWFATLTMGNQTLVWIIARIISFPFMECLHVALAHKLNTFGCGIVAFLGEWIGAACQFYIFDTALAPLLGLRTNKRLRTFAACLESHPFLSAFLLHTSHLSKIAPYVPAIGVPCVGNPWQLFEAATGTALGQLFSVGTVVTIVHAPWAGRTISTLLEPSLRWFVDLFIVYNLWQAQRADDVGAETSPEVVTEPTSASKHVRVLHFGSPPPPSPVPDAGDAQETPEMPVRRGRGRPKGSLNKKGRRSATPVGRSKTPGRRKSSSTHHTLQPETVRKRLETHLDGPEGLDTPSANTRRSVRLSTKD